MIGLVDGNNFYVSCERIFDLSLEGKPVAVLSNNDGCVISRSNEFKALNIAMGTPYFQLKPLIKRYELILKSSNYELYGDISRRLMTVLHEFTADVEPYSIDEAFIHVNLPAGSDYFEFGQKIRQTILKWVGVPCGIGFSPTKTLSKIANHIAKKQPSGIFVMPDAPCPVLEKLPVSEIWGVGRRLAPKLEAAGIHNAWQMAMADETLLRKQFNVTLAKTARELRGEPVIAHEDAGKLSQSVSCSRSFGRSVTLLSELTEAVAYYTASAATKLRKESQLATGANVYFEYYPEYKPCKLDGGVTALTVAFETPTSATSVMTAAIIPKLTGIFIEGKRYRKAGIVFWGLESDVNKQIDLFADTKHDEKTDRLSAAMDKINRQSGKETLFYLSEGIKKPWVMKRELLTPSYTTNWDQILTVK